MFKGEERVSKTSAKDCNAGRGGHACSQSIGGYPLQKLDCRRRMMPEGRSCMPKWRYQGVDSTCSDGAGKYAECKKPGNIGRGGEIRKVAGSPAQEPSTDEGFSDIEERQDQPANDSMMSGHKTAKELREISRAEVGGPPLAGSQKQISEQNTICDPDEICLGSKADEYSGKPYGEKASCEAQGKTVSAQPATDAARGSACNVARQLNLLRSSSVRFPGR